MNRKIAGVLLLTVGLALVAATTLTLPSTDSVGDVGAVESALRPDDPTPVALGETTTTTTPPPADEPKGPSREQPNNPEPIAAPVGLRIDRLAVDAPVDAYGVDSRGQMDVPDNVTDVGWYKFGPSPGEPGSAVLAAHVDLAGSGPGVFFDLDSLEEGDRLAVIHADGTETPFRVIARATYEKEQLPVDVIFSREGPSVLTLITCGGGFNQDIARYDSNVVVYAVPDLGSEKPAGSSL